MDDNSTGMNLAVASCNDLITSTRTADTLGRRCTSNRKTVRANRVLLRLARTN